MTGICSNLTSVGLFLPLCRTNTSTRAIMMIASASFPPILSAPRLDALTQGIHLKLQHPFPIICKRPLRTSLCECISNQNGGYLYPTLAGEVGIAATFIEDKLAEALSQKGGNVRQIVLLSDGVDDRNYRLLWPPMTLIFHVSSQSMIRDPKSANVPKSCLVRYIHADLEESVGLEGWTDRLRNSGYQGDKPSVWAVEGINFAAQRKLRKVLENISSVAMQGSLLVGELSSIQLGGLNEDEARLQQLEKIFLSCGFRIKSILNEPFSIAETHGADGVHVLFVAEQLRLSDDQVKMVMRETELVEESGDEDTFEDW